MFKIINCHAKSLIYIAKNLEDLKIQAQNSVEELMGLSSQLVQISTQSKNNSEELIAQLHINPSPEQAEKIKQNQDSVDQIIALAPAEGNEDTASYIQRKASSKLSKNAEAISKYEIKVSDIITQLVGSLSNEDLMNQFIKNLSNNSKILAGILLVLGQLAKINNIKHHDLEQLNLLLLEVRDSAISVEETEIIERAFTNIPKITPQVE